MSIDAADIVAIVIGAGLVVVLTLAGIGYCQRKKEAQLT